MNVFKYVAESNPNGAVQVINSFGYDVTNTSDLGKSLSELVAEVGEPAFKKVMDNHPDKDVILELFATNMKADNFSNMDGNGNKGCGCANCNKPKDHYMYADGSNANNTNSLTSVAIIGASLLLAVAIITKNK